MPKQNRPLVRDGRLQAKKKRTDRSYLRPNVAPTAVEATPIAAPVADDGAEAPADAEAAPATAAGMVVDAGAAAGRASQRATASAAPAAVATGGHLPTTVRAIQQQGVRKRREFDIKALAIRDTNYAKHELRRIATLAAMVIVTLVVLTFVLR